jgi:transketolase
MGADNETYHYLVVEKVRESSEVRRQAAQKFEKEKVNLRKVNELEVRKQYQINIRNIKEKAEALIVGSKEIGLEVNANKPKYMVMSQEQNEGRSLNMKIDNRSFEMVEQFKYLATNLTNQNSTKEGIKSRLKSGMLAIIRFRIFCLPI